MTLCSWLSSTPETPSSHAQFSTYSLLLPQTQPSSLRPRSPALSPPPLNLEVQTVVPFPRTLEPRPWPSSLGPRNLDPALTPQKSGFLALPPLGIG